MKTYQSKIYFSVFLNFYLIWILWDIYIILHEVTEQINNKYREFHHIEKNNSVLKMNLQGKRKDLEKK
jgi:hypothetical protein